MTDLTHAPAEAAGPINRLYFAVWRWHFYAGLYVIPFLLMLAVTGFLMMILTTLLPEYGDRLPVTPAAASLPLAAQEQAALAAVPGATGLVEYIAPHSATTPALFNVAAEGGAVIVALDPHTGAVLRQTPDGGTWYAWLERVHGSLLIGDLGDRLIEIAASLGLLMVATGLYLVWPRGAGGWRAMVVPRLTASGRALWKSLHQVVGTWISLLLVGFLVTGLAWAGVWGGMFVQPWNSFPAEKWGAPLSDRTHQSLNGAGEKEVPWGLELTPLPESGSAAGVAILPSGTALNLTSMAWLARELGMEGRFRVSYPQKATGVWTLGQNSMSYDGPDPTRDRTVHVDQYSGRVLADVRYADYAPAAKAMAVGIALHEGQMGLWNLTINAVFCLATVFLCLSGVVLWWKRRPAGALRLAAPPRPQDVPLKGGVVLITLALSMLFPMLGLTLLVVLALDLVLLSAIPPLRRLLA
jgi:uncharacterized iron-regulated membrane protein